MTSIKTLPSNAILQLSSPGSGSTLLANILNTHPELVLMNEVFAKANHLIPIWELWKEDPTSNDLEFRRQLYELYSKTFPFGIESARKLRNLRFAQALAVKSTNRIESLFRKNRYESESYRSFYVNSFHQPPWNPLWETIHGKSNSAMLLFKDINIVPSLKAFDYLYPDGKIIYLIRHPLSNLFSTINKARLHGYNAGFRMNENGFMGKYGDEFLKIKHLYSEDNEVKVLLNWRMENELMLKRIKSLPSERVFSVTYSRMVTNLDEVINEVYDFIGKEKNSACLNLINRLKNNNLKQKHERSIFRPLKLNKLSEQVPFETLKRWSTVVNDSELMEYFKFEKYI